MNDPVDLLIIGGGINGAGIARDAAGRGLSVRLVEQGDIAGATSWASSKLIHGGLRYLEHYEFRLVRESLAERETLLRIAPHLTRPLRFVIPHTPDLRPAWMVRLGLLLYDGLASRGPLPASQAVDLTATPWGEGLKPGFGRGFVYSDVQVDDARLVVANLRDAVAHGAQVAVRTRCVGARREGGLWRVDLVDVDGQRHDCRARALVNAAGPWAKQVLDGMDHRPEPLGMRLVRGSHIVVPRLYAGDHAYTLQNSDRRVVFLLPFHGDFTLIGTTEVEVGLGNTAPQISNTEIDYLCAAASRFSARPVGPEDVVWQFSGVRPLLDDGRGSASAVTREYALRLDSGEGEAPLLSVFGGKLTTYRRLAEKALERLASTFPAMSAPWTATRPLPGGDLARDEVVARLRAAHPTQSERLLAQLAARHGSGALALLDDDPGHHFGGGLYEREVEHFIAHEWARQADDILWRRSKAGLWMTAAQRTAFTAWLDQRMSRRASASSAGPPWM